MSPSTYICNAELVFFIFNPHLHAVTGASKNVVLCVMCIHLYYFLVVYKLFSYGAFNGILVIHVLERMIKNLCISLSNFKSLCSLNFKGLFIDS